MRTKVILITVEGIKREFYAKNDYQPIADGHIIYWELEDGDTYSIPVHQVKEVTERPGY